jgi:hypothetical protein
LRALAIQQLTEHSLNPELATSSTGPMPGAHWQND